MNPMWGVGIAFIIFGLAAGWSDQRKETNEQDGRMREDHDV